jgi:predicted phosphohydrolase
MKLEFFMNRMSVNVDTIVSLTKGVGEEQARWRPAPDKWSILEVIGHLYDEEQYDFRTRIDFTINQPGEKWPPFDPVEWMREQNYNEGILEETLHHRRAARRRFASRVAGARHAAHSPIGRTARGLHVARIGSFPHQVRRAVMRAVWCNDIHLDFLEREAVDQFLRSVTGESPDVVLVGGDISTARRITDHLRRMEELIDAPILFVLGNHDFYHGSIHEVRRQVGKLCGRSQRLHWLNEAGVYHLSQETALVGHDGWGDAREGNYLSSPVELSDFFLIDELTDLTREELVRVLRELGDESAAHFRTVLPRALASYPKVVVLTHVPPFREATWYEGEISNDNWLPFFCGSAAGIVLKEIMSAHPNGEMTVLCGHTHGEGETEILPNLRVVTGGARYGAPCLQPILELD